MSVIRWHNWSRTQHACPRAVCTPNSTAEVAATVREAAKRAESVRMVGSGHSFTAAAVTEGTLLAPTALARVRGLDAGANGGTVTVEAGLPLCDLNEFLSEHGMALANLGDIAAQTVGGAIQTGTHGTGRSTAGLAQQVVALELVLADGSVVTCSAQREPHLFAAARLGLGAFGVLTAVTFAVVPAFLLHAQEEPMFLDAVLDQLDSLRQHNEHFEFYWFPYTNLAQTKQNNTVAGPVQPLSHWRRYLDDELLQNSVFDLVNRLAHHIPRCLPAINQVSARALSRRTYTDAAHRVLTTTRRVRFVETEYAIPAAETAAVLREIRTTLARRDYRISFPLEIRFAPADEVWLSLAHGRDTAYIAAHVYERGFHEAYFADLEAIFTTVNGRPHWGKLHTRNHAELRELYPRMDDAVAVRERVDPQRRFTNAYLNRVLGP